MRNQNTTQTMRNWVIVTDAETMYTEIVKDLRTESYTGYRFWVKSYILGLWPLLCK